MPQVAECFRDSLHSFRLVARAANWQDISSEKATSQHVYLYHNEVEEALAAYQLAEEQGGPNAGEMGKCFVLTLNYLPSQDLKEAGQEWEARYAPPQKKTVDITLLGLGDEQAVERMKANGLDLLIDLTGFLGAGRPQIFADRPAPVQAHLLGYVTTTGLSSLDYRFSDAICDPPERDYESSEKVIRLFYQGLAWSEGTSCLSHKERELVVCRPFGQVGGRSPAPSPFDTLLRHG